MTRTNHRISAVVLIVITGLGLGGQVTAESKMHGKTIIQPFNYEGVQLLDGRLKDQFEQIRDFYCARRTNDILKVFREQAGLRAPGKELGGAFGASQFGQWLSAFARMYKVTGNTTIKDKAVYLMDEWAKTIAENESLDYGHYTYDKVVGGLGSRTASAEEKKDLGVQFAENPPMQVISKTPPAPAPITDTFEIREGFTLIKTLDEFRAAIKKDNQKIRMKPGIYRAEKSTVNLARGKRCKVFSSIEAHGWSAARLTDGQVGKIGWSSKAFSAYPDHTLYPEYIVVDLGVGLSVSEAIL